MTVTDKRERVRNKIKFADLAIGDVYETVNDHNEAIINIKTNWDWESPNCIFLENADRGDWETATEDGETEVVKIATDLILRRDM